MDPQPQFTQEVDEHKEYLQNRLNQLYSKLSEEDQKFADTQMFAIDENQALLQEAHRLRDENIAVNQQLQQVSAMLQALRVKDLTNDLRKKSIAKASKSLTKSVERDKSILGAESVSVKSVMNSMVGDSAQK